MTIRITRTSKELVRVEVTADADPTATTPEMAVVDASVTAPISGDFKAATWEAVSPTQPRYIARMMIGPGVTGLDFSNVVNAVYPLHKRTFVRMSDTGQAAIVEGEFVEIA